MVFFHQNNSCQQIIYFHHELRFQNGEGLELGLDADKSDNLDFEYHSSSALWRYLILKLDYFFLVVVENVVEIAIENDYHSPHPTTTYLQSQDLIVFPLNKLTTTYCHQPYEFSLKFCHFWYPRVKQYDQAYFFLAFLYVWDWHFLPTTNWRWHQDLSLCWSKEIALASIQRYQIINKIETTKWTIRNTHL